VPERAGGVVLFAHGSGSSRASPRNRSVAWYLNGIGLATMLVDLLTPDEEQVDQQTAELRFDIPMLARRLVGVARWLGEQDRTAGLPLGLFGASTGAAAALIAAADLPDRVQAVVSRGGRPDLAAERLADVRAPTLLLVGERDPQVLEMNRDAQRRITGAVCRLEVVPLATHLFEEPGALERVAELAGQWFAEHLGGPAGDGQAVAGRR
jgi:putative phosphoribosyl transferase